jgi:glycosyltransferase involved in cell wall biosynthesis
MSKNNNIQNVAFLSSYIPRRCGIASFTADLRESFVTQFPHIDSFIVSINDNEKTYNYNNEVRFEIHEQDIESYLNAADFLNFGQTNVISVQHEFGIFGGNAGSHIVYMLRKLKIPIVTTLHTVLDKPDNEQLKVMNDLAGLSTRFVVMTEKGKKFLKEIYNVDEFKVDVIPHGIPDMSFIDPNFYKDQFGVEGKYVLLTFGLLSPNKGIENVIKSMPLILERIPNVVYIVQGATHPHQKKTDGELYRRCLEKLVYDLNLRENVIFYNKYVNIEELKEFLGAADIYITPYLNKTQITSGTLAYAFGSGKAIISTPYWHAEELLADERGIIVPFNDPVAIAEKVLYLLENETDRHSMRKKAYIAGREMIWSNVAQSYYNSFLKATQSKSVFNGNNIKIKSLSEQSDKLPKINLNHIIRLTDNTGILQHAKYSIPNFAEGYCLDDNARALMLMALLENTCSGPENIQPLMYTYAAFLNYAFDINSGRFKNFMSYNRVWIESKGSEDSHGRALWALGTCINKSHNPEIQNWASELFSNSVQATTKFSSPRAWAFSLLGISEYCQRWSGDRSVNQIKDDFENKLFNLYKNVADTEWEWFEKYLTYSNAQLSHSLIACFLVSRDEKKLDAGLNTLKWLCKAQRSPNNNFNPIGNDGFYFNGGKKASYDQQPVEAFATISACLTAYKITEDNSWLEEARNAFEWFLGKNDEGIILYDSESGGCRDGLHLNRANQNMGTESTLAYLLSLTLMHLNEETEIFDKNSSEFEEKYLSDSLDDN